MMQITKMKWAYKKVYGFYDVIMELDGYAYSRIHVQEWKLKGLDMDLPDAVAYLLRAKIACVPERGVEKA